jgi:AmmeMemoRadiSam system protein A
MFERVMLQLTEADQVLLLQIARKAVRAYILSHAYTPPEIDSGNLTESCGIFVSIHKDGALRGCIGNVHGAGPLYRTVGECAISAAVGDPRFVPVAKDELALIDFEISVLSPLQRVLDISEIEIGTHGLLVTKRGSRGLLLPQVATAYGWDRETFLRETCRKAGLRYDDWKDGAAIHRFSAFVFGEKQLHQTAAS